MHYFEISGFLYDIFGLLPFIVYAVTVKSDEDCINCFNRHKDNSKLLFSRYQVRKDNCIETITLKQTQE